MPTDRLQRGMTRLASRLKGKASRTVTVTRGAVSISLAVTVGTTLLQLTDELGAVRMERTDRDFIFTAADYDFGSGTVEPERGDVFTETDTSTGKVYTFKVLPYAGEPCWRWCDPHRQMVRAHTKLTGEEES